VAQKKPLPNDQKIVVSRQWV